MDSENGVRINKWISMSGYCSRREADRLVSEGKVTIDGKRAEPGSKVSEGQAVVVEGKRLVPESEEVLLLVNKPRGVVCTTDQRWGDRTVEQMVNYPVRVFTIGRLDKESEGLILMTNRGELTNRILKAGNAHEKEYIVTVDRPVTAAFLKEMERGVYLEELQVRTLPCRTEAVSENCFRIILIQGLNRQIRRMCRTLGYSVTRLVRIRILNFRVDGIPPGGWREAKKEEYSDMLRMLDGQKGKEYGKTER